MDWIRASKKTSDVECGIHCLSFVCGRAAVVQKSKVTLAIPDPDNAVESILCNSIT